VYTYVRVIVHSRDQELNQGFQRARHKLIITIVQTPIVLLHRLPVTVSSARIEFAWIWSCLWHIGPVDENISQLESCNAVSLWKVWNKHPPPDECWYMQTVYLLANVHQHKESVGLISWFYV